MGLSLELTREEAFGALLGQIWELGYLVLKRVKAVACASFIYKAVSEKDQKRLVLAAKDAVKGWGNGMIFKKFVFDGDVFLVFAANTTAMRLWESAAPWNSDGFESEALAGLLYGYSIDDIHKYLGHKRRTRGSTKR